MTKNGARPATTLDDETLKMLQLTKMLSPKGGENMPIARLTVMNDAEVNQVDAGVLRDRPQQRREQDHR